MRISPVLDRLPTCSANGYFWNRKVGLQAPGAAAENFISQHCGVAAARFHDRKARLTRRSWGLPTSRSRSKPPQMLAHLAKYIVAIGQM